jgi:hypothetical protein
MSERDQNRGKREAATQARVGKLREQTDDEELIIPDRLKVKETLEALGQLNERYHRLVIGGNLNNYADLLDVSHPVVGRLSKGEEGIAAGTLLSFLSMVEQATKCGSNEPVIDVLKTLVENAEKAVDLGFENRMLMKDGATILPEPSRRGRAIVNSMREEATRRYDDSELNV